MIKTPQLVSLIECCVSHLPNIQAIYLFGSWQTENEWPNSDIDIGLLLPIGTPKSMKNLYGSPLNQALELLFMKDIDLINLRHVSTVLQKEVIRAERRIYCAKQTAADEFEMLTLSYYQKLNEERASIIQALYKTKRVVHCE